MTRILVCGGRDFDDRDLMANILAPYRGKMTLLIQGGAPGADTLADEWAQCFGIPSVTVPAQWHKHGRAAGPIRNKQMLEEYKPDAVIAFPGGRGTKDMMQQAQKAGVLVVEAIYPTNARRQS